MILIKAGSADGKRFYYMTHKEYMKTPIKAAWPARISARERFILWVISPGIKQWNKYVRDHASM